jgi:hypothetical protein
MKTLTLQETAQAKCEAELTKVKTKGFVSFYMTVAQMIADGYILDHADLTGKLDITLSNLRCCNQDELVPEKLHIMVIVCDIAIEEAIDAAK